MSFNDALFIPPKTAATTHRSEVRDGVVVSRPSDLGRVVSDIGNHSPDVVAVIEGRHACVRTPNPGVEGDQPEVGRSAQGTCYGIRQSVANRSVHSDDSACQTTLRCSLTPAAKLI
jgi:hypothetical protein